MKNNKKLTNDEFISRSRLIHGNKYDYSNVFYVNSHSMINIICPIHGVFLQRPYGHLYGYGCSKCAPKNRKQNIPKKLDNFINESIKIHGTTYDYSLTKYKTALKKVRIICKKHGSFLQKPNKHLSGQGCFKCKCGYKISKPEILFLNHLKIKNRQKYIKPYKVDGIDYAKNIIYEFLGDYYHGNPKKYESSDYNKTCHKTFGELYSKTVLKFNTLNDRGYSIYYMWESDWNSWKKDKISQIPLKKFEKNTV